LFSIAVLSNPAHSLPDHGEITNKKYSALPVVNDNPHAEADI
jgi:hypothetical protein